MVADTWEDTDRLFKERRIEYREAAPDVPIALTHGAFELLDSCRIPFEQADRGVVFLLDSSGHNVIIVSEFGIRGVQIVGRALTLQGSPLARVVGNGEPLCLNERALETAPDPAQDDDVRNALRASSCVLAPIADNGSCWGAISVLCRERAGAFSDADVSRLARKGKYATRDLQSVMTKPEVAHWYRVTCEALRETSYTDEDVHVLLEVFGAKLTTQNEKLAEVLTSDVGDAASGLGLRVGDKRIGGARRYSSDEVRTILRAFGIEITAGAGRLSDLLTTDVRTLLRGPKHEK